MDKTGTLIQLTVPEMAPRRVTIDLRASKDFGKSVDQLSGAGGAVQINNLSMLLWARESVTLYRFTRLFDGQVTGTGRANWQFTGTVRFKDIFDFDSQQWSFPNTKSFNPNAREPAAELQTRLANMWIDGKPFDITSVAAPLSQSSANSEATWAGTGMPTHETLPY